MRDTKATKGDTKATRGDTKSISTEGESDRSRTEEQLVHEGDCSRTE
jgi:hypothetical protein